MRNWPWLELHDRSESYLKRSVVRHEERINRLNHSQKKKKKKNNNNHITVDDADEYEHTTLFHTYAILAGHDPSTPYQKLWGTGFEAGG